MGVLVQLFAEAEANVVLGSPFMQSSHGLSEGPLAIAAAAALARGIAVDILGTEVGLREIRLEELARGAKAPLRAWVPASSPGSTGRLGFHSKFCLADETTAYIGSANFTGPGLESQLEMGLLVHGQIAREVRDFWRLACDSGFVELRQELGPRPTRRRSTPSPADA
jgi:phosphatidylserine/phosphatidylglycerophosphate/cardiolipin synthase-like enzyme